MNERGAARQRQRTRPKAGFVVAEKRGLYWPLFRYAAAASSGSSIPSAVGGSAWRLACDDATQDTAHQRGSELSAQKEQEVKRKSWSLRNAVA